MNIGKILKERMNLFDISISELSERTLIDENQIKNILQDKLTIEQIDIFDLDVISYELYCTPEYFIDHKTREADVLFTCRNRGTDNLQSILAKARIQKFVRDIVFLEEVNT